MDTEAVVKSPSKLPKARLPNSGYNNDILNATDEEHTAVESFLSTPLEFVSEIVSMIYADSEDDVYSFKANLSSYSDQDDQGQTETHQENDNEPSTSETIVDVKFFVPPLSDMNQEPHYSTLPGRKTLPNLTLPPPPGFNPDKPERMMGQHGLRKLH